MPNCDDINIKILCDCSNPGGIDLIPKKVNIKPIKETDMSLDMIKVSIERFYDL
ncbi:hypothetical protein Fmac_018766 [Flemingia macrophylla]|uniref:Uncharacterized protein n=1 Tax=Flemingia macrophylla TaxID=520843 RepID=A0ABD1M5W1_9FABA